MTSERTSASRRRAGRPPGPPGESRTREQILEAARTLFSEQGFDRTSLRGVAGAVGVDVALVSHYFGSKQRLFAEAAALPVDPAEMAHRLLTGPREGIGRRLVEQVLDILDTPEPRQRIVALVRAAASEEGAAQVIRDRITREMLEPVAAALGSSDAPLRAALTNSQLIGLLMSRHVLGIAPMTAASRDQLVAALAPTLQRYLTGALDGS